MISPHVSRLRSLHKGPLDEPQRLTVGRIESSGEESVLLGKREARGAAARLERRVADENPEGEQSFAIFVHTVPHLMRIKSEEEEEKRSKQASEEEQS